jgi:carbon monoxide dehydrogenase subunit G
MNRRDALRALFAISAMAAYARPSAAYQPNARARVDRSLILGDIDIVAYVDVPADASLVWTVLTDYNRLADFIPDMHTSRVVSKPGEVPHVYQKGDKTWLLLGVPLEMVFRMDEQPNSRIRFRLVSGNIKKMFGEWQIVQKGNLTRINYRAHMEPGFLSLRAPGDHLLIESDIAKMMNAIGMEILKRMSSAARL